MRAGNPFLIRSILILCLALTSGCVADPTGAERTREDTQIAPLTEHGPTYPPDMQRLAKTGFVSLDCTITRDGQARDCMIIKTTNTEFADAAKTYIADARYRPATQDGIPVAVAHHIININFSIKFKPQRLVYDCLITVAGRAKDCRSETSATSIPPTVEDIVLHKLELLPMAADNKVGKAIEDPHRMIEVLLTFQEKPGSNFSAPSLPVQTQLNLLLACGIKTPPQCREIPELPFSTALQSYENDRFVALSIGFNGIFPVWGETKP